MNPLTKVKLINELNEREADLGVSDKVSWHSVYKDSAWVFVGGFPYELSEGDIICVFSQYGEVVNINLVRDKKTGKSKGFCFLCYEDQRSTVLAVDNFNGIKIKGRTIRVDHVKDYRPPKDSDDIDDVTKRLREEGCAPRPATPTPSSSEEDELCAAPTKKLKKEKKEKKKKKKKEKKKKKKKERQESSSSSSSPSSPSPPPPPPPPVRVKEEKQDAAYDKYNHRGTPPGGQEDRQRGEEDRKRRVERDREWDGQRETDRDKRRETDRRDTDRRETERDKRRETDRRDTERRETERRHTDRRETDRRDTDRRETDRRDTDRRDLDRRDTDRRDLDRRDTDSKRRHDR